MRTVLIDGVQSLDVTAGSPDRAPAGIVAAMRARSRFILTGS